MSELDLVGIDVLRDLRCTVLCEGDEGAALQQLTREARSDVHPFSALSYVRDSSPTVELIQTRIHRAITREDTRTYA